jgi:hypothetical protein
MIILSMCLAMFAACKKGGDCAAAAKSVDLDKKVPADMAGKIKDVITKHCNDDKWPKEATDCFGAAKSDHEAKACAEKLPKDAQEKLMTDMMPIMMGAMGKAMENMGSGMPAMPPAPSMAPAGSDMGSAAAPAAPAGSAGSN